jgi:hypothetical protein
MSASVARTTDSALGLEGLLATGPSGGASASVSNHARPRGANSTACTLYEYVPWLSEEIPEWNELNEEEREAYRAALEDLGMWFPDDDDDEDDDYCE